MKGIMGLQRVLSTLFILSFGLLGCHKQSLTFPRKIPIKIKLDSAKSKQGAKLRRNKAHKTTNSWGLSDPDELTEFNCLGVFITYPELEKDSECTNGDDETVTTPHLFLGTAAQGTILEAEVLEGEDRLFEVVGFKSNLASCPTGEDDMDALQSQLSAPFILGSSEHDLGRGENALLLKANYPSGSEKFVDCEGPTFDWEIEGDGDSSGGTVDLALFGDGSDGDATVTTSVGDTSTDTGTLSSGRKLQPFRRLSSVDATGTQLTLNDTLGTDFQVEDVIFWSVVAADDDTSSSCGGNLTRGKFGFGEITAASGSTITIDEPISDSPASIVNSTMVIAPDPGSSFCLIQVARVPQFDNLTLDSTGGALTISPPGLGSFFTPPSPLNPVGGIFIIRVKETLTVTGNNTITISATDKGFRSDAVNGQGTGVNGKGDQVPYNAAHGNAGGGFESAQGAGGGGGVSGAGGNGNGSSSSGAPSSRGAVSNCPSGTHCILFGGGGGKGSVNGGHGGGAVVIYAKNIVVNDTTSLVLEASSSQADDNGTEGNGGGGGGYIRVDSQEIEVDGLASFTANADGGAAGDASGTPSPGDPGGGGGGGGEINLRYCDYQGPTPTLSIAGGLASTDYTSAGFPGAVGSISNTELPAGDEFCP